MSWQLYNEIKPYLEQNPEKVKLEVFKEIYVYT